MCCFFFSKSYILVSFDIDKTVSCALEKWYNPETKKIAWPPGNQATAQIVKYADKKSTWKEFDCHLLMTEHYPIDHYAKAIKLEQKLVSSDVSMSSLSSTDNDT